MKERGILFSAPMVRALLAGRKTQTRRILKPLRTAPLPTTSEAAPGVPWRGVVHDTGYAALVAEAPGFGLATVPLPKSPYGVAGDRLWVRETWSKDAADRVYPCPGIWYRADFATDDPANGEHARHCKAEKTGVADGECFACAGRFRWKPAIHMLRRDSRITLEVENVRVEPLQDISEEDAKAEGVEPVLIERKVYPSKHAATVTTPSYRAGFERLWGVINGEDSWRENPWVWVPKFRTVHR